MDYISATEIAGKWGVNARQVQKLLASGRIPGAVKYGRFWMIPADAQKPADLRCTGVPEDRSIKPLAPSYVRPKTKAELDERIFTGEGFDLYSKCGTAYFRGDFERTLRYYSETESDPETRLSIAYMATAAAVSIGNLSFYEEVEAFLKGVMKTAGNDGLAAVAEMCLASTFIAVNAVGLLPEWLKKGDFSRLPESARLDAIYYRAKYFQSVGDYASLLAVSQTALSLCDVQQSLTFPGVYFKLLCAFSCHSLERQDEAERWLSDAVKNCMQYGYITPLTEHLPIFGEVLEHLLKKEYPEQYELIIAQWQRTYNNWLAFYNFFADPAVPPVLSLREYEMAFLAAQGIASAKIAARFHISLSRQKAIMGEIYSKLGISSRRELKKYLPFHPKNDTFLG